MDKELTIEEVIEHLKAEYERAKKKKLCRQADGVCAVQRLESSRFDGKAAQAAACRRVRR